MTDVATRESYGSLVEPTIFEIQRRLPGPIERVWSYLVDSDKRRRWLASGDMGAEPGGSFELVWRNDELTDPPGPRPETHGAENRLVCTLIEKQAPYRLAFQWGTRSTVRFTLAQAGSDVILTVRHERLPDRGFTLSISSGWHMHLNVLAGVLGEGAPEPFWDGVARLKRDYTERLPA